MYSSSFTIKKSISLVIKSYISINVISCSFIKTNSTIIKGKVIKACYNSYIKEKRSKKVKNYKKSKVKFIYYTFYYNILCSYYL